MAKHKTLNVQFPLKGLDRSGAHRQQPPYTSRNLMNVRPFGSLQGRERGGSRPGLVESHLDNLGAAVRMLAPMTLALGDGFTAWSDTFSGTSMAAAWTQASWAEAVPSVLPTALASVSYDTEEGEVVLTSLPIDTTEDYVVEMFLVPWSGDYQGKYRIYLRLDDTTPDYTDEGAMVELWIGPGVTDYIGHIYSMSGGIQTASNTFLVDADDDQDCAWLSAVVSGDVVSVYWNGALVKTATVDTHAGCRVGFGLDATIPGGVCLVNTFRVQYYSTGVVDPLRSILIASADGDLFRESVYGRMTVVASDLTVRDDVSLCATQSGQKLYIADYGDTAVSGTDGAVTADSLDAPGVADWSAIGIDADDMVVVLSNCLGTAVAGTYAIDSIAAGALTLTAAAGTGACSYRVERAPKVFDPLLNTISILTATVGQVPTGCPLVCRYIDRLVLAGAEIAPHVWYMSRQGDETDWDYAETDSQRAVAGTSSEAGVPGSAITALIPHSDDYLIMGCRHSIWRLRGDPAFGGSLDALSHVVGIAGPNAWCLGPAGELVFLSLDGLYALAPGGESYPISISRESLPMELLNINPDSTTATLEFDLAGRGVHIYLTPDSSNTRTHWWLDWSRKTFWPVSLDSDHEPTATCAMQATAIEESGVILGGRDGTLRRLFNFAETDCGTAFTTYAEIGPIPLAKDGLVGSILAMSAVMAEGSGDVTWGLYPALTFEGTDGATVSDTGTWSDGLNATNRPGCRGQACVLKLTGSTGRGWGVEQIAATVKEAGRRRIP